jgi:hypothetical protein
VETLSFDPWHAPEESLPLGERKAAGKPDGFEPFD